MLVERSFYVYENIRIRQFPATTQFLQDDDTHFSPHSELHLGGVSREDENMAPLVIFSNPDHIRFLFFFLSSSASYAC